MKKLLFITLFLFASSSVALATDFKEGVNYEKLEQQPTDTGDKIEVLEFFWYGCPHCYHFEPALNGWLKTKPDNVTFIRVPAIFRPDWKVQARAYYALERMGVIEKMHDRIFDEIHKKRKRLNTLDSIADFVAKNGVDRAKFVDEYNSFEVDGLVRKALKKLRAYHVDGVPTLAVNGKYKFSGRTAGSHKKMIELLNDLIKKESGPQKP